MAERIIHILPTQLKEVKDIIDTCKDGTMPFEQTNVVAQFYFNYQDINALIDEAERLATEDVGELRDIA